MATEWSWNFFDAAVIDMPELGLSDVLREINYTLRGMRGDVMFEIGGRTSLGPPNKENFTPFAQLTRDKMVDIVSSVVDVAALKKQVDEWHDAEEKIKPLPFE
jgi:hypothetical protein